MSTRVMEEVERRVEGGEVLCLNSVIVWNGGWGADEEEVMDGGVCGIEPSSGMMFTCSAVGFSGCCWNSGRVNLGSY